MGRFTKKKIGGGGGSGAVGLVGWVQGGCERRIEVFVKIQKKWGGGGSGKGGGQGGCERRIKVFVKIKKKKNWGGGFGGGVRGGGGRVGGVRSGYMNEELKFL